MAYFQTHLIIFLLVIAASLCNNITTKFPTMDSAEFQTRQNRLISFNTLNNGDISMELAFNVPFITIPVKKSVDMAHGAIANLNIGAVLLAGAIAIGFAILVPGIGLLLSKKSPGVSLSGYRNEDGSDTWRYLALLDQALADHNIDTSSCMQRMVCWTVKNSAKNVSSGQSSSSDKIVDGLATNQWVQQMIEGTAIHSALRSGLDNANCSKEYGHCKITQRSIQMLAKKFVETINSSRR